MPYSSHHKDPAPSYDSNLDLRNIFSRKMSALAEKGSKWLIENPDVEDFELGSNVQSQLKKNWAKRNPALQRYNYSNFSSGVSPADLLAVSLYVLNDWNYVNELKKDPSFSESTLDSVLREYYQ